MCKSDVAITVHHVYQDEEHSNQSGNPRKGLQLVRAGFMLASAVSRDLLDPSSCPVRCSQLHCMMRFCNNICERFCERLRALTERLSMYEGPRFVKHRNSCKRLTLRSRRRYSSNIVVVISNKFLLTNYGFRQVPYL